MAGGISPGDCNALYPYGEQDTTICATSYSIWDKFTGYRLDPETGLEYAHARYYNPSLGRFMSADPFAGNVGNPQSLNRFAYVQNNPLNFIDPTGLFILNNVPSFNPDDFRFWLFSTFGDTMLNWVQWNAPGLLGSREIQRKWTSTFQCNLSPEQLMDAVKSDFSNFADMVSSGNGSQSVFSPGPIVKGQQVFIDSNYSIGGYSGGQTNAVTVISSTPTSFTFTVMPGQPHFMAPGSTVSFGVSGGNGQLTFTVAANAVTADIRYTAADMLVGHSAETATWKNLEANVQKLCK